MSTTMIQTQVKETPKARSPDSHKARKRKHVDEPEEPATEKKKKRKKPRTEENDHSLLDHESLIKKSKEKKKKIRSLPVLAKQLTSTSPSAGDVPDSTAIIIDDNERQATLEDHTTPLHSPSPSTLDNTTPSPFYSVRLSLSFPPPPRPPPPCKPNTSRPSSSPTTPPLMASSLPSPTPFSPPAALNPPTLRQNQHPYNP